MLALFYLLLVAIFISLFFILLFDPKEYAFLRLFSNSDEDIKIADGKFSHNLKKEDSSEAAAAEYMEQKQLGNIDRAEKIGDMFAQTLINSDFPLDKIEQLPTECEKKNTMLLYSYVVNRVIREYVPNSLIGQKALNVFYEKIEKADFEISKHIADMAAFSLYMLCERSNTRDSAEIGRIYADLCDFEHDLDKIRQGNEFYAKAYDYCVELINHVKFQDTNDSL